MTRSVPPVSHAVSRAVLFGLALLPLLAGCANDEPTRITYASWKQAQPVPQPQLSQVPLHHAVVFPVQGGGLSDAEREALAMFLQRNGIAPGAQVTLSAALPTSGDAGLLGTRLGSVRSALAELGYYAASLPPGTSAGAALPADGVVVTARVLAVAHIPCPGYNTPIQLDLEHRPVLSMGCSNAVNLGLMLADPQDLQGQATLAPADGAAVLPSIDRYRTDQVWPAGNSSSTVPFRMTTQSTQ